MNSIYIKDNENGNYIDLNYSQENIIIETENDKAEITGILYDIHELIQNNLKVIYKEIQISEESAFGKVLELINEKYKNLEIIYTVKYDENTVLDVIRDFSKVISKNTDFEIHCTGGTDWITKVNDLLIYGNVNGNTIIKDTKNNETSLQFNSDTVPLSEINDLVDEFNDISVTFGITSI